MLWTKQGSCTDFKSYVKEKTGVSFNDFVDDSKRCQRRQTDPCIRRLRC